MSEERRAILYARYSPRREESDSIKTQMADLHDWCEKNNAAPILCCYDPAVSGTVRLRKRPGLLSALDNLKKDMLLVVRNLSRMARSLGTAVEIEEEVYDDIGASIASIEDGGVLDSEPTSTFTRQILYAVHDLQRKEINIRTSRRMLQRQADGHAMGGQPPFGFSRGEDGMLVSDDTEQNILNQIKLLKADGLGCRRIARLLNDQGYKSRRNIDWTPPAIQHLLKKHGG